MNNFELNILLKLFVPEILKTIFVIGDFLIISSFFFVDEEVHFMHICENSTDQTPINELLQIAGVKPVSFPKDKPIIDV